MIVLAGPSLSWRTCVAPHFLLLIYVNWTGGLIVLVTEPHRPMACCSRSWGRLPAYLPFVLLESRQCNYPHLTWPSLPSATIAHLGQFSFLMPVCTLVVDIWLRRKAEHSANSVIIQCCGTERCNSQSPLAHRSNCVILSSTGVIAHTHTHSHQLMPGTVRPQFCVSFFIWTHTKTTLVSKHWFSAKLLLGGGKKAEVVHGWLHTNGQMFCLVVRILRYKSVRVVGFYLREPNWSNLVQSEVTFTGQRLRHEKMRVKHRVWNSSIYFV